MKQEYIGTDTATMDGKSMPVQVMSVDGNIADTWLITLAQAMGYAGQQLRLVRWIVSHIDDNGQLSMSQRMIAEKSGIPIATVARAMARLQGGDTPYIIRISDGAYQINPKIMLDGSHGDCMGIVYRFSASTAHPAHANAENNTKTDAGARAEARASGEPTGAPTPKKSRLEVARKSYDVMLRAIKLENRYDECDDHDHEEMARLNDEMMRLVLEAEDTGGVDLVAKLPFVDRTIRKLSSIKSAQEVVEDAIKESRELLSHDNTINKKGC